MVPGIAVKTRRLGTIESAISLSDRHWPMNLVAALRLEPAPDPVMLQAALDQLQQRHPALRARIDRRRRRHTFVYDDVPPIPLQVVDAGHPDAWIEVAEAGLNTGVPTDTGPLVDAALLKTSDGGDLVITFHHAIVDAASAASLLDELLDAYAALARGDPPKVPTPLDTPAAVDDLFPPGYRGVRLQARRVGLGLRTFVPEIRYRLSQRRAGGPSLDPAARTQVHSIELDGDVTTALSRAARRDRLTVTSVLHAAALSTIHRFRYQDRPVRLRSFTFPDLRPHLDPGVPAEPLACYMALSWADVPMIEGRSLLAVARDVQDRIDGAVRGGAKFVAATMAPTALRTVLATKRLRMGNAAVSHTGVTSLADRHGPLEIRALHAFVSNLAAGPEFSLRTGVFRGRLTLDATTLDTDMDRTEMGRMVSDVAAALEATAGPTNR